jgi:hypothetical protein
MKGTQKEIKSLKSKFYGNLIKSLDYPLINYEELDFTYGYCYEKN